VDSIMRRIVTGGRGIQLLGIFHFDTFTIKSCSNEQRAFRPVRF
jgi:hypothetical protein